MSKKPIATIQIARLSGTRIERLRKDIVLNSLFIGDYKNRYNIEPSSVCEFFNGYVDYLWEMATEDGFITEDTDDFDVFNKYDNSENLKSWQAMFACGLGC